jgi:hypothetical protein
MVKRRSKRKKPFLKKLLLVDRKKLLLIGSVSLFIVFCIFLNLLVLIWDNVSLKSDRSFTDSLDKSLKQARLWILSNRSAVLGRPNAALLRMLDECSRLNKDSQIEEIVNTFMLTPLSPDCWKALIDPNRPVNSRELNETFKDASIDNKWVLCVISKENLDTSLEKLGLFDGSRWKKRLLTHQLWALTHLRERMKNDSKIDRLVNHLTDRLKKELTFDTAVVDIYIQKIAFTLRAGFPEKIRRRWIERVIADQSKDGGWNDQWFWYQSGRRPVLKSLPSNQHTTIQAYWLLCQVKYEYPDYFGVLKEKDKSKTETK